MQRQRDNVIPGSYGNSLHNGYTGPIKSTTVPVVLLEQNDVDIKVRARFSFSASLSAFPSPRENPGAAWYWMLLPMECSCFYRCFLLGGVASADAQDMGKLAGESIPECGCFYIRVRYVFVFLLKYQKCFARA